MRLTNSVFCPRGGTAERQILEPEKHEPRITRMTQMQSCRAGAPPASAFPHPCYPRNPRLRIPVLRLTGRSVPRSLSGTKRPRIYYLSLIDKQAPDSVISSKPMKNDISDARWGAHAPSRARVAHASGSPRRARRSRYFCRTHSRAGILQLSTINFPMTSPYPCHPRNPRSAFVFFDS